jgi:hypothetical protein
MSTNRYPYTITLHTVIDWEARTVGPPAAQIWRSGTREGSLKRAREPLLDSRNRNKVCRVVGPTTDVWCSRCITHTITLRTETIMQAAGWCLPFTVIDDAATTAEAETALKDQPA